jgi:hypothetical protein
MIAQGGQVTRCVESHSVHPISPPDFPEKVLFDPAHEAAPQEWRLTTLGNLFLRDKPRETIAASINYFDEPRREISFCLLDGANP